MKQYSLSFLLVLFAVAFPAPVPAEMYKWTDKSGVVHYSSEPGDASARLLKDEDLPPVTEMGGGPPSGMVTEKTLIPGTISVSGRLLFDGRPLSEFSTASAMISLYSNQLKKWFTPDYSYDPRAGTFELMSLAEGKYMGQATVDADGSNPDQYPGDYKGSFPFSVAASSRATVTADMERIIHLTSPEDNGVPLPEWGAAVCENKIEFETPVAIAWEPVGKDVSYSYMIIRTVCQPFAFKDTVVADKTTATRVVLGLQPNREGEFYTLRIDARKNNRPVGSLMTHGKNGYGWDYRFRVLPKRGGTRLISPIKN